ncbi:MAG: hypothetical protein K2Q23_17535, partial [Bryobacteraceae bacterium]|nr:hypothetical protein [Bryobacteraceae bacterium]
MVKRAVSFLVTVAIGLAGYFFILPHVLTDGWAAYMKATGRAEQCSWGRTMGFLASLDRFAKLYEEYRGEVKLVEREAATGLDRFRAKGGRE